MKVLATSDAKPAFRNSVTLLSKRMMGASRDVGIFLPAMAEMKADFG
jgi:hypothetical protein